jgi:cysteine-rich repeat protein
MEKRPKKRRQKARIRSSAGREIRWTILILTIFFIITTITYVKLQGSVEQGLTGNIIYGPTCGDFTCESGKGEDGTNCPEDCGIVPGVSGDGICSLFTQESCENSLSDCGPCTGSMVCGNGICNPNQGEAGGICAVDCGTLECGDGKCAPGLGESSTTCAADCPAVAYCGNSICESANSETSVNCPGDCSSGTSCGNGILNTGEGCDDSGAVSGDGCSSSCQVESGWSCSGTPSVCTESASACSDELDNDGDGIIDFPADPGCASAVDNDERDFEGLDTDGDGILNDGDNSGKTGDNRCRGGETVGCDDNCAITSNADQADADGDGIGDACDQSTVMIKDKDSDGVPDDEDNCIINYNPLQSDSDKDKIGNVCDNCVTVSNSDQADADGDGIGDACEGEVELSPEEDAGFFSDATIYEINDGNEFEPLSYVDIVLKEDDSVVFLIEGDEHSITLLTLTSAQATIKVESEPALATLSEDEATAFDLTGNGAPNIAVKLNKIEGDAASFTLVALDENSPLGPGVDYSPFVDEAKKGGKQTTVTEITRHGVFFIIIILTIAFVIVLVLFRAFRNRARKTENEEENSSEKDS